MFGIRNSSGTVDADGKVMDRKKRTEKISKSGQEYKSVLSSSTHGLFSIEDADEEDEGRTVNLGRQRNCAHRKKVIVWIYRTSSDNIRQLIILRKIFFTIRSNDSSSAEATPDSSPQICCISKHSQMNQMTKLRYFLAVTALERTKKLIVNLLNPRTKKFEVVGEAVER